MVFLWFAYGFPMVFSLNRRFPVVFLPFSHFPMVSRRVSRGAPSEDQEEDAKKFTTGDQSLRPFGGDSGDQGSLAGAMEL